MSEETKNSIITAQTIEEDPKLIGARFEYIRERDATKSTENANTPSKKCGGFGEKCRG